LQHYGEVGRQDMEEVLENLEARTKKMS